MALGGLASRAQVEAMAAGRSMVEGSATTWRRVTDGNPCGFCAMLASRGPVYGSRADALTVTGRGKAVAPPSAKRKAGAVAKGVKARGGRKLGEEYHERCGCSAEPFEGRFEDWQPTPEEQIYKDAYAAADWYDIGDGSDLPLPKKIDLLLHEPYDAPREMLERFLKDMDGDQYDLLRGKLWAVDGDTPADIAAKIEAWLADPANAIREAVRRQDGFEMAPLLRAAPSVEDAVGGANPLYATGAREYTENCSNCSVAFEARMRGYDVTAAPHSSGRNGMSLSIALRRQTDGEPPRFKYMKGNGKREMSALSKDDSIPIGSRGIMGANWKGGGGGHFWNWEKTAGGIRFYDAQSGNADVLRYLDRVQLGRVGWMRTDDCDFVGDLSEWVVWE